MIPPWKEVLARACQCLEKAARCTLWILAITPEAELMDFSAARSLRCRCSARFRGYAFLAVVDAGD